MTFLKASFKGESQVDTSERWNAQLLFFLGLLSFEPIHSSEWWGQKEAGRAQRQRDTGGPTVLNEQIYYVHKVCGKEKNRSWYALQTGDAPLHK